mgnify:CR=1 FL=1
MSSPDVWTDARARIEAYATAKPIAVAWPNERFTKPQPPAPWLAVETYGDGSEPIELGRDAAWIEEGSIDVHVMVPVGSGVAAGLAIRKEVQDLFRGIEPAALTYDGAALNRLGPVADDGVYRPLTVRIFYRYQSR